MRDTTAQTLRHVFVVHVLFDGRQSVEKSGPPRISVGLRGSNAGNDIAIEHVAEDHDDEKQNLFGAVLSFGHNVAVSNNGCSRGGPVESTNELGPC